MTRRITKHGIVAKAIRQKLAGEGIKAQVKSVSSELITVKLYNPSPATCRQVDELCNEYRRSPIITDNIIPNKPRIQSVTITTDYDNTIKQDLLDKMSKAWGLGSLSVDNIPDIITIDKRQYPTHLVMYCILRGDEMSMMSYWD